MKYLEITSYEAACQLVGTTPAEDLPYANPQTPKQHWLNAAAMLETWNKAINMDDDGKEWDRDPNAWWWEPLFYRTVPGVGFSSSFSNYWYTRTSVGARLSYRDEARSDFAAKHCAAVYEVFLTK